MASWLAFSMQDLTKIGLALLIGGLIGSERELRDKAAGLRTMMLVCVGSTIFTLFSFRFAPNGDVTRISAAVVTGIGFLGAGVIMREGGQIKGLTTASTVWLVSALGMGIGGGEFGFVIAVTLIILFVLWAFPRLEAAMGRVNETRTYEVLSDRDVEFFHDLEKMWKEHRLRIHFRRQAKSPKGRLTVWVVSGPPSQQDRATEWLFSNKKVIRFRY